MLFCTSVALVLAATPLAHSTLFLNELQTEQNFEAQPTGKISHLPAFFAALAAKQVLNKISKKHHNGRCDGDCAHCPHTMGTDTEDGTMATIMFTVVSLAATKAVAACNKVHVYTPLLKSKKHPQTMGAFYFGGE